MTAEKIAGGHGFNLRSQADRGWWERADVATALLARVRPAGAPWRIADVGCGDRKLARSLEALGGELHYAGFDLLPQSDEVTRFDVERDVLPGHHDVVALLGVSEYLADLVGSLARLRDRATWILASHVLRGPRPPTPERLAELGWRQHLTEDEFLDVLRRAGLHPVGRSLTPDGRTLVVLCSTSHPGADR